MFKNRWNLSEVQARTNQMTSEAQREFLRHNNVHLDNLDNCAL